MPGFKGGWEDGSGSKCILEVSPLLSPFFPVCVEQQVNTIRWGSGDYMNK